MYASFLGISGALHLSIFQQPVQQVFFSNLLLSTLRLSLLEEGAYPLLGRTGTEDPARPLIIDLQRLYRRSWPPQPAARSPP